MQAIHREFFRKLIYIHKKRKSLFPMCAQKNQALLFLSIETQQHQVKNALPSSENHSIDNRIKNVSSLGCYKPPSHARNANKHILLQSFPQGFPNSGLQLPESFRLAASVQEGYQVPVCKAHWLTSETNVELPFLIILYRSKIKMTIRIFVKIGYILNLHQKPPQNQ